MNKELILKYKAEFDHWLNGGEGILSYCFVFTGEQYQWLAMYEESDVFEERDVSYDIKSIVINDEYVEFRKALAEGKTIQFKDLTEAWNDLRDPKFKDEPRHYRIKPEEPQFKEGDFVKLNNGIAIVGKIIDGLIDYLTYKGNFYLPKQNDIITKWNPNPKELCWFTNDKDNNKAILDSFHSFGRTGRFKTDTDSFKYCEPFLNSKPSWFKD